MYQPQLPIDEVIDCTYNEPGSPAKALELCIKFHKGQTRRGGEEYWEHPAAVADLTATAEEASVAYLHDILEDTQCTVKDLRQAGFSETIIQAVIALTMDKEYETYEQYIFTVKHNPLARKVKILDMFHNISDDPTPKQKEKYFNAIKFLL